jgi:hypothetical protein
MTAFELRMYPRALEELQGALEDPRRPLPPEQRAQVTELIEKTKAFLGRYQLQLAPKDAELLIDGTRQATDKPLVLGVGIHQLVSRTTGYADLYRELVVQGGEDETLELRLIRVRPESPAPASPAPEPQIAETTVPVTPRASDNESSHRPNRISAIVALSAAGLGVAVGTTSGIIAFTKKHDLDHTAGYRAADISTGSWIVAGAAGATGLILWLLQDAESEKPHVQPVIGLSSLGVAGTF